MLQYDREDGTHRLRYRDGEVSPYCLDALTHPLVPCCPFICFTIGQVQ